MFTADETWDKLSHGLFVEIRIHAMTAIIQGLLARGLADWSQVALTTDDRSATATLRDGATDHNVRTAIAAGLPARDRLSMRDDQPGAPYAADALCRLDRPRPLCRYRAAARCCSRWHCPGLGRRAAGRRRQALRRQAAGDRLAGLGDRHRQDRPRNRRRRFPHPRRPGPRNDAGRGAAAIPLATTISWCRSCPSPRAPCSG